MASAFPGSPEIRDNVAVTLRVLEPIGPVSYTHLDVYKRQLVGGVQVVGRGRIQGGGQFVGQQLGAAAQFPDVLVDRRVGVAQFLAVGADRLGVAAHEGQLFAAVADVYKRQGVNRVR